MIFVTVGTNEARFDRLLHAVAELPTATRSVVVQHGHSIADPAPRAELVDFLSFDAMVETIRRAAGRRHACGRRLGHGRAGERKRPIVVPRRKAFGEAVDDHQLQLGRRFAAAGLVTLVEAPEHLGAALSPSDARTSTVTPSAGALAADLGSFLSGVDGSRRPPRA